MPKNSMDIAQAFAILGIGPQSSNEQARLAYRRLVKRWHPDQFALDPGARDHADARLKTINQAYALVKTQLRANPVPAETAGKSAPHHTRAGGEHRFTQAFHFSARVQTPSQPRAKSGPPPRQHPQQRPAADFQEALELAGGRPESFGPPAAETSPKPSRPPRRLRPMTKPRSRSTRIEPVEPVCRIRPVAPISPIGED